MKIKVAGIDPSLAHFGMCKMTLYINDSSLYLEDLYLIDTEKRANKSVRQNSDDLRRCQEIIKVYHDYVKGCAIVFSEIPTGAQSARAMFANGAVSGLLASCPVPLIQVQPFETKLATVGTKTASKEEMIEWAGETYPDGEWLRRKSKGVFVLTKNNEHLADAVAVVHAGLKTDEFQRLAAMWKAQASLAA